MSRLTMGGQQQNKNVWTRTPLKQHHRTHTHEAHCRIAANVCVCAYTCACDTKLTHFLNGSPDNELLSNYFCVYLGTKLEYLMVLVVWYQVCFLVVGCSCCWQSMAYLAFHCRLFTTHGIWDIDVLVAVKCLVGMMRFGGDHLGFLVCSFGRFTYEQSSPPSQLSTFWLSTFNQNKIEEPDRLITHYAINKCGGKMKLLRVISFGATGLAHQHQKKHFIKW